MLGAHRLKHYFLICCFLLFLISSNSLPTAFQPRIYRRPVVQPVETDLRLDDSEEAEERDNWFYFQRAYPFTEIPVNLRRQAFELMRRERTERNLLTVEPAAAETWRLIGPAPTYSAFPLNWGKTSGRINTIAISPIDSQL